LKPPGRSAKFRGPSDRRRDAWKIIREHRWRRAQVHRVSGFSAFGDCRARVLHLVKSRVTIHRIKSEPSIIGGIRGIRSRISGFDVSGFSSPRNFVSWIRDPRNPEEYVARWVPKAEWETGGNIPEFEGGRSKSACAIGVRGSGLCGVKGS
jgi:hypothetical protein